MNNHQQLIVTLKDESATRQLGENLAKQLGANSIILLQGNLGAGKTTLIQGLGSGLGITEPIVSPTFTLINEYTEGRLPLYHIDLYRLSPEQIKYLHLENYWQGEEFEPGIVAIEWANLLPTLPPHYLDIELLFVQTNQSRKAIITAHKTNLAKII
jgi:tRNA threonylcarbamoyladenosine biosynthesis protein TsaE